MAKPLNVRKQSLILHSTRLSEGSYAKVYWDRFSSKQVIKVMNNDATHQSVLRDIGFGAWFVQEGDKTDYIVRHCEILHDGRNSKWGIAMDYGGVDLQVLLSNRKRGEKPAVTPSEYMHITGQALVGLYRLHKEAQMMHRDLKPANLFWDGHKLVFGDFNLSLFLFENHPSLDTVVQTRWYRAPEVLLGDTHYTSKIDVWSLGLILLYLWSGYVPRGDCALEQLWLACALGGTPPPHSYLTRLTRWDTVATMMGVPHIGPEARSIPLIIPRHNQNGFWTTSLLEKHLQAVPYPDLCHLLRGMLQVDPTRRLSSEALVHSDAFQRLFSAVGPPPPVGSTPTMALPAVPEHRRSDLGEALTWGLNLHKSIFKFAHVSHGVWFGYAWAVFRCASENQDLWICDKTSLAALHYMFWALIDDVINLSYYKDVDGVRYACLGAKVERVLAAHPDVLSLYFQSPWCCAIRQVGSRHRLYEDRAAGLLTEYVQGAVSLTYEDLLKALKGER